MQKPSMNLSMAKFMQWLARVKIIICCQLNISSELKIRLKGTPCRTFMADMKVKVGLDFFYPDVMVVCQEDNENEYYKTAPVIIVEILSKSTRRFDQTDKRLRCQRIPSLEEYVLIEQDKGEIQVFSKKDQWQSFYYYLGDEITFSSLGVTWCRLKTFTIKSTMTMCWIFCGKKVRNAFYAPIVMTINGAHSAPYH